MVVDHDSIELDKIGTYLQTPKLILNDDQSVTFPVEHGGDGGPEEYPCRTTDRGTLACLTGKDEWLWGVEFRMMPVTDTQRASRTLSR